MAVSHGCIVMLLNTTADQLQAKAGAPKGSRCINTTSMHASVSVATQELLDGATYAYVHLTKIAATDGVIETLVGSSGLQPKHIDAH